MRRKISYEDYYINKSVVKENEIRDSKLLIKKLQGFKQTVKRIQRNGVYLHYKIKN